MLLPLLAFLGGTLAVIGIYSVISDLFLRDRSRLNRRVDEEFRKQQLDRVRKSALFKNLSAQAADAAAGEEGEPTLRERLEIMLEQSGTHLSPRRLTTIALGVGLGVGLVATVLTLSLVAGLVLFIFGALAPLVFVAIKRNMRLAQMTAQLPDAFDLMARVIRAGQTVPQSLQAVADEFSAPLSVEFAYCYEQQNLGLPPELALRDLARRTGLLEIKIFVLALLVQQQAGGNLAELLDKLATIIRERSRISGKIKSLTAEGCVQALVLLALPLIVLGILTLISFSYVSVLYAYPGYYLLLTMLVFESIAAWWIRKIVNFDF